MTDFNQRFIDIVQLLQHKKEYLTLQELSNFLHVSKKTIARTIKTYEEDCKKYGFTLIGKQGAGYTIQITDAEKFGKFTKAYFRISTRNTDEKFLREREIIQVLLAQNSYITVQALADLLFISESTAAAELKVVRHRLQSLGLKLIHKPSKGIRIEGSEMNVRLCYAKYVMNNGDEAETLNYTMTEISFVEKTIYEVLRQWQVQMSDLSRDHFVGHVLISIYRMKQGFFITFDEDERKGILQTKEYRIAEDIVRVLQQQIEIIDLEEEIIYLAVQLLGKRSLSSTKNELTLTQEIEDLLIEIFNEINLRMAVDLTEDDTVFNYLALHFEPMFTRLKYGITSNNPLLEEVKSQQATSFEMGLIAKEIIMNHYQYVLNDDEVSYLAMYFSLALDRLKYLKSPKNILVVCGLGVCSSRILVYKLRQQYGDYIHDIVTCQFHELRYISLRSFDCIISTVNQPIGTSVPVVYIDDFLNDLNNKALDNFFLENNAAAFQLSDYLKDAYFFQTDQMENEEQAIQFMLDQINQVTPLPSDVKENILAREKLSSTAFGNFCALPHPLKMCTEETIFSVLILGKSMLWGGKRVRVVFLLLPSKHHPQDLRRFNEALAGFILDSKLFAKFSDSPTFETLKSIFLQN